MGIDSAEEAVSIARKKYNHKNIKFDVMDVHDLLSLKRRFDIAIVRGVLHHLNEAERAIANICQIADEVIIAEANGYNPVLKIIEKVSPYHINHEEKSYPPYKMNRWVRQKGATIVKSMYVGLVPVFCPDFAARALKLIEPVIEKSFMNKIICGCYVMKIKTVSKKNEN